MREKIKIITYECKKCNKTVHFFSNEEYSTQCKTCKNEMIFCCENNYNPKSGLSAINARKAGSSIDNVSVKSDPTVECPYCHSTDTKKITNTSKAIHTAVFGIFSLSRNSKNFHCNKCGSDF